MAQNSSSRKVTLASLRSINPTTQTPQAQQLPIKEESTSLKRNILQEKRGQGSSDNTSSDEEEKLFQEFDGDILDAYQVTTRQGISQLEKFNEVFKGTSRDRSLHVKMTKKEPEHHRADDWSRYIREIIKQMQDTQQKLLGLIFDESDMRKLRKQSKDVIFEHNRVLKGLMDAYAGIDAFGSTKNEEEEDDEEEEEDEEDDAKSVSNKQNDEIINKQNEKLDQMKDIVSEQKKIIEELKEQIDNQNHQLQLQLLEIQRMRQNAGN